MINLTELEKKIIASIQGDIPITERPFLEIAQRLGVTEETLLEKLQGLSDKGVIRRFGATLRHQKSGFEANAMVAWKVREEQVDAVGENMASFREVSHCYRREPTDQWPYNIYTMVHAKDEESCREIARRLSAETSVDTYTLLFSRKELKKTSMQYFPTVEN
ncbi:siroheme decarboxylase subunit beta [Desulfonema magnum]|uniref:siroheme decarboxylase n=1 Tax=Desulfonema magnum TaxID=45655 RepID=A0A975BVP9_9BACT|nr:Lrp/AsnC family transcriptional regulator [Desulfonema magnum]QTA92094.1 AsnC-like ligand binding domain-containing protein [Desulfonema magnum]